MEEKDFVTEERTDPLEEFVEESLNSSVEAPLEELLEISEEPQSDVVPANSLPQKTSEGIVIKKAYLIIGVAVALVLLVLGKIKKKMYIWATGLIIAGGIGNMIDRLSLKYVVDFIEVKFIYFPYIFNIADCCVVIGCSLIALQLIIEIINEKKEKKIAESSLSLDDEIKKNGEIANE